MCMHAGPERFVGGRVGEGRGGRPKERVGKKEKEGERQTDRQTEGERDRKRERQKERWPDRQTDRQQDRHGGGGGGGERERGRENSNSNTLFHKDCSLGSVKSLKPVLNWANVCSPEHTSDTSTNYDSFLN